MLRMNKCPECGIEGERVRIALHLTNAHGWLFNQALDWLRNLEEQDAA